MISGRRFSKKFPSQLFRKSWKIAKNDFLKTPENEVTIEKFRQWLFWVKVSTIIQLLKFFSTFCIFENLQTLRELCKFKKLIWETEIFTTSFWSHSAIAATPPQANSQKKQNSVQPSFSFYVFQDTFSLSSSCPSTM